MIIEPWRLPRPSDGHSEPPSTFDGICSLSLSSLSFSFPLPLLIYYFFHSNHPSSPPVQLDMGRIGRFGPVRNSLVDSRPCHPSPLHLVSHPRFAIPCRTGRYTPFRTGSMGNRHDSADKIGTPTVPKKKEQKVRKRERGVGREGGGSRQRPAAAVGGLSSPVSPDRAFKRAKKRERVLGGEEGPTG